VGLGEDGKHASQGRKKVNVERLTADEWRELSEGAHKVVFEEQRPSHFDRIDYALLAVGDDGLPQGYLTARELDSSSVYWQYGGAFPGTKGSSKSFAAYQEFVRWTRERYGRVTTLVQNTNVVYLKMAMSVGFRIIGVRCFHGDVFCELMLEFEEK
jgi:hypothetical protein